jgi:uncharacterized protein (TIGR04255 family)
MSTVSRPDRLANAPITEAILDITVEADEDLAPTVRFAEQVAAGYPNVSPIFTLDGRLSVRPGERLILSDEQSKEMGRICWNVDKTRAVQARINGFTVNHVKRYESWQALREEARLLWERYVTLMRPKRVVRIALRFINRINVPSTGPLSRHLQTRPEVGSLLPQSLGNFFLHVELPYPAGRVVVIKQASSVPEPDRNQRDLLFDIDAIAVKTFPPNDDGIWVELDHLRDIKNECFYGSLNEPAWRQYA